MNIILNIRFIITLTIVSLILSGCKSLRVLPNKGPLKNIKIKELTKALSSSEPKLSLLRSRIKVKFDDGNRVQPLVVNLRMEKDKAIWLSAKMIIPIAKLLITPEKVLFYEKFQKKSFEGDLTFLKDYLGINFSYKNIENLLIGKSVIDIKKGKWELIQNPKFYVISPRNIDKQLRPIFFFDPSTFMIKEQRFIFKSSKKSLIVYYDDFQKIEGKMVPSKITIFLNHNGKNIEITLEYSRAEIPNNLTFPFKIPSEYSPIEFK